MRKGRPRYGNGAPFMATLVTYLVAYLTALAAQLLAQALPIMAAIAIVVWIAAEVCEALERHSVKSHS